MAAPLDVSPYAPPAAPLAPAAKAPVPRLRAYALACIAVAVIGPVPLVMLASSLENEWVLVAAFLVTVASGAFGVVAGLRLLAAQRSVVPTPALAMVGDSIATLVNLALVFFGAILAFASTAGFSRGRQIRSLGKALLPPVTGSDRWLTADVSTPAVDEPTRAALAAQWRENGRTEHASVAAFARLTLDLVALGAPPALVASAQRDALDEIRHAELCFSLAHAIDGAVTSPAAFPAAAGAPRSSRIRSLALAELAVSSLVDGALNEGVSARIVARLAKRCEDAGIRAVLREIAADEGRHAAHGWDVVRFCLAEGGAPVAHALVGAARVLPPSLGSTLAPASHGGAWERWGIPGAALEAAELAKTRADVVRRVEALVRPYGVALSAAA